MAFRGAGMQTVISMSLLTVLTKDLHMRRCKIHLVAGTRPNVMKVAPLFKALDAQSWVEPKLIFLEQHNSRNMGGDIFSQLGVRKGQITWLPLEKGGLGERFGSIISVYSQQLREDRPDLVVVPGDVDVSLGTAIAAKRELVTVAHLEAGLRSNDKRMPEELNRIMIDAISDILLAPSEAAAENLIFAESRPREVVHFVGNIMIDSLISVLDRARGESLCTELGLAGKAFSVATFHRPANVDDPAELDRVVDIIEQLSSERTIVFPIHPRTHNNLTEAQHQKLKRRANVLLLEPMAYPDFINLIALADFVITDSGGIQEETSYLGVPCFTVRETTERPITTIIGSNVLVSFDDVLSHTSSFKRKVPTTQHIPLWDGETALRCAHVLNTWWRIRTSSSARG